MLLGCFLFSFLLLLVVSQKDSADVGLSRLFQLHQRSLKFNSSIINFTTADFNEYVMKYPRPYDIVLYFHASNSPLSNQLYLYYQQLVNLYSINNSIITDKNPIFFAIVEYSRETSFIFSIFQFQSVPNIVVSKPHMAIVREFQKKQYFQEFIWEISTDYHVTTHQMLEFVNKRTKNSIEQHHTVSKIYQVIGYFLVVLMLAFVLFISNYNRKMKQKLKEGIEQKAFHIKIEQQQQQQQQQQFQDGFPSSVTQYHLKIEQTLTKLFLYNLYNSQSFLQEQRKIISKNYQTMVANQANQANKIDLLMNALKQITQQLNIKEQALTIKTISLAKAQLEAQQYQLQIKDLKLFIQQQQREAAKTNEDLTKSFNQRLKKFLQESREFYTALVKSKEEYYNNKINILQSQLNILNTINSYKDKAHDENAKNNKSKIVALQEALEQTNNNLRNNIDTQKALKQAKQQNKQLLKRIQTYEKTIKTNKQTISILGGKNSIGETISKLHYELLNKNLQQIMKQIDNSQQGSYNSEVIDLLKCIYQKYGEQEIELINTTEKIQQYAQSITKLLNQQKQSAQNITKLQDSEKRLLGENQQKIEQLQQAQFQLSRINESLETLNAQNEESKKQVDKLRTSLAAEQQINKKLKDMEKDSEINRLKEKQREKDLQKIRSQLSIAQKTIEKLLLQNSSMNELLSTLKKQIQLRQQKIKRINQEESKSKTFKEEEWNKNLAQIQTIRSQSRMLQTRIQQLQTNESKLKQQIKQLENRSICHPQLLNNQSGNQKEEAYKGIIQNLKKDKQLQQSEIASLRDKLKFAQTESIRSIKRKISPAKSPIKFQRNLASPKKSVEQKQQKEVFVKVQEMKSTFLLFRSICILENEDQGRSFLTKTIQHIYDSKKVVQTVLFYKYSSLNKVFSFLTFKQELQNECFVFLFSNKTNKFGLVSYKKDSISKQSALIVSITNKKIVSKRPNADNLVSFAVLVDTHGNLTVGCNHWQMKPSALNLMVKSNKYFQPYEKKEVFGPQYWREQLDIKLTEFEIYRIILK